MSGLRVLVLCSDTGVRVGDGKGASLHLRAVAHALAAAGHEVDVVGVAAGDGSQPWDVPVHLVPHPGRSTGLERERRKRATVARVAALGRSVAHARRPDLVYERLALFGSAGLDVARAAGAGHVVEVNALLAAEEAAWRGLVLGEQARRCEQQVLARAGLRVAVSQEVAQAVEAVAAGPTVVVPNGVDTALFADLPDRARARAAFGLPHDGDLVVFSGTIRPWHGLDVAVEALALLPDGVRLVVAGDGPGRADLVRQAAALGVAQRIHWLGAVPHAQIPAVLAAGDVALAPYPDLPGFFFSPLKVYEYLAAGIPVVASAVGQVVQALDGGRFGRLVTPGDPLALADVVAGVLADPRPARVRAALARQHALAEHGWSARVASIVDAAQRLDLVPDRTRYAASSAASRPAQVVLPRAARQS